MDSSHSFLILGPDMEQRRAETALVAKSMGIGLSKNSPDIFIIFADKQAISIDKVRDLKKHIFQKPVKENYKFVIIENAGKLTTEAQNALLKILEEPPRSAIIVLEAKDKGELLPTVLSRLVTKRVRIRSTSPESQSILLDQKDPSMLLKALSEIENPEAWLDQEIITLHRILKETIKGKHDFSQEKLTAVISGCRETKEMLLVNVNPKFALANLFFLLNYPTKN